MLDKLDAYIDQAAAPRPQSSQPQQNQQQQQDSQIKPALLNQFINTLQQPQHIDHQFIEELSSMGFDAGEAADALRSCNNNFNDALDKLLRQNRGGPSSGDKNNNNNGGSGGNSS